MRTVKFLLVSEDIAARAGVKDLRTKCEDGRYVLYEGDMKLVHLLPEEYVTGIQGIEVITEAQAQLLIEAAKALEVETPVVVTDESDGAPEEGSTAADGDADASEGAPEEVTEEVVNDNDNNIEEETDNGTDEPSE